MLETSRRDEIVELRKRGQTYTQIGLTYDISRQRVGKILKPNPRKKPKLSSPVTMLTVRDVSSLLRVHVNTVRRWNNRGLLKAYRIGPRGDRRFGLHDVARFLAELTFDRSKPESNE